MGNNVSSDKSDTSSLNRSSKVIEKKASLISNKSIKSLSASSTVPKSIKRTLTPIRSNQSMSLQEDSLNNISEKKRGKLPEPIQHLPLPDRHLKRIKPAQKSNRSSVVPKRERYNSTISVSGFSSTIGDPLHFSMVGDSTITDITNVSSFSVNSFLDKIGEDNNYIMHIPDSDYSTKSNLPSIDHISTTDDIINLLLQHPNDTYDLLTAIYGSDRMKNNLDLQREAFQAAETWSLRPTDVIAKTIVACCKLCGWGTPKSSKKGFQELQALAKKGVWEAYYYLGQCYDKGVEQANEGYNLSGRPLSVHVIQSADKEQAIYWYKKVIETTNDVQSVRVQYYIADAQFRIAAINFTSDKIDSNNVDENINYLKQSVSAGNRKAEFSLGLLIEAGYLQDDTSAKQYYTRSAMKNFPPAQVQLALILLKDNSPEGITWLNNAAKLGDPRAYHYLGESYEFGRGVKADPTIAVQNYQTSAETYNFAMAEFRLGMHYFYGGLGLPKDYTKAFHYLDRAAHSGLANAQYMLGIMYRDGQVPNSKSIKTRKEIAFRWIRKAAAQRLHTAITQLANCYEEGVGTPVNNDLATEYYEIATSIPGKYLPSAQQTYARFLHKTGNYKKALEYYLYASGMKSSPLNTHPPIPSISRIAKRMVALLYLDEKDETTPFEPQQALDILISLANAPEGDADAQYWIAVCYEEGVSNIIPIDLSKAFDHYVLSANLGSSDSQFQVGHMLCKGIGVEEDRLEAFTWFQKAAEQNNPKALYYIGIYYYNGSGSITRDIEQALVYFKRAAELKHIDSMVSYAQICQEKLKDSTLSPADQELYQNESFKWYTKAAKHNQITALRELGRLYGSNGDFKTSAECYMKASSLNDALSTLFLGGYYEKGQGVTLNKQTALSYYTKAIELGHPTALFAIAELYENLKDYANAYTYYKRVSEDSRISKNFKSSRTSRLKMALYSLHYDPNTFLYDQTPLSNPDSFASIDGLLSKPDAFKALTSLAKEEKFLEAFNWIAECYQDGQGVSQNLQESLNWRIKASEAGDMNATMRLAFMYEKGVHGVQKNTVYSHQLYQMCADKNNVYSQHKLGMTFWRGQDIIPINLGMAVVWFTKSARQGYAASHWALGQIALENGDLHIAMAWWETAIRFTKDENQSFHSINLVQLLTSSTGDSDALIFLGKYIQNQQEPVLTASSDSASSSSTSSSSIREEAECMSRAQQENHGLALRCFGQAALMGNVEGMYLTAQAWHKDKDYPVALENYEKAAAKNHIPSRIMRATYQIYGLGGKEINAKAGYQELLLCAESDPDAYIHLGRCCERGLGTPLNIIKALEWYQRAIETLDSSEAMFRVGQIYAQKELTDIIQRVTGDVVDGEMEAVYWYERAVSKDDHPRANFRLAFYFVHGVKDRLEPNLEKAIHHFRRAAKQNDLDAMFELGQLLLITHEDKYAVFPSELQEEGIHWYEIAADRGCRDAQRELGNLYHSGREEPEVDEEEEEVEGYPIFPITQDFEKAYDYFSFAAHLGDKTAALFLGTYYEHGIDIPPNMELAQHWYTMAIEIDNMSGDLPLHHPSGWWPAQLCLARVLYRTQETQSEAYKLFLTVYSHQPEQHLAYLEFIISMYELKGLGGVPVQAEKAAANLLVLAEQGYLKAFLPVAECYESGNGLPKDDSKALQWYVLLIHNPDIDQDVLDEDDLKDLAHAYYRLAEFYRKGIVVSVDLEKSETLYRIAAERASKEAKQYLASISYE